MKKPKMTLKEMVELDRKKHREFREYYGERQANALLVTCAVMFVYGAIIFLSIADDMQKPYAGRESVMLMCISAIAIISILTVRVFTLPGTSKRHSGFAYTSLAVPVMYLTWGYLVLWYSVVEGKESNFLPILMVYTICSIFLYFSIYAYFTFFILCLVMAVALYVSFPVGTFDRITFGNVVLSGAILTIGGAFKYITSSRRFFAAKEAEGMRMELYASNEELTSTNAELMEITDELRRKSDAQKLFTAGMSHELRSPLNGIIGLLQVMEEDKTLSEDTRDNMDKALSSSLTLIQIVNDLLDYYKLEAGEFNIIPGEFDLREVVSGVMTVSSNTANSKGIKLTFNAPSDMPAMFIGDGLRIRQIITNIVSNGVKYTEKGYVHTTFAYNDGILTIVTEDSGQGISKEAQGQLFDPFKRFNENKNKYIQGTGLGLSIVKKLIDQMGGDITVESELKKGTAFTIRIPLDVVDNGIHFGDVFRSEKAEVAIPKLAGKHFMCVDDNRVNLQVFKGLLKGTDAKLTLIKGGKECLEKVKEEKFDLIFMDHLMPEMDGIETYENMKTFDHLNKETPVVMLTANAGAEAEQSYMDRGFDGYLSKPVLRSDLYEMIDRMIK